MKSAAVLFLATLALGLPAAEASRALDTAAAADPGLKPEAAFVAGALKEGASFYYRLPAEAMPSRDAAGRWRPAALQAAMQAQGPLVFRGATPKEAGVKVVDPPGKDEGRWLLAAGLPRVLLLENSSTVAPLSKGLDSWKWPHLKKAFDEIEAAPARWLDAANVDLVVFSSPGWWEDFANPPGGPSRLPAKVAEALQAYVRQGGAALFIDIAQWDLEKAWPHSLSLAPLGPYSVSKLELGEANGGLSLAPVGVAAERLTQAAGFRLAGSGDFLYPDGGSRELNAAFAMPDPGGGQGWIAGLAFHVFEQDDSLALAARRLLLNLLLLAGNRRLTTQGEPPLPSPGAASPTLTVQRSATPSPTEAPPTPTPLPTQTPLPPTPTEMPTEIPTLAPTLEPMPSPTPVPTAVPTMAPLPTLLPPTALPTLRPTEVPTQRPTAVPTPVPPTMVPPTAVPTRAATPLPTLRPTLVPTAAPTRIPTPVPTAVPTRPRPTPVPTRPRPTLVPTRVWSTPVPTWTRPTAVPTLPRPTAVPTLARPTPLPTLARPTPIATFAWPSPPAIPTLPRSLPPLPKPKASPTPRGEPTPRPTAVLTEGVRNALGCLSTAPEPFGDGGAYVKFCLRHSAQVRVEVFDLKGRSVWRSSALRLEPGSHQVSFEGWIKGARLPAGGYLYQVDADYGHGQAESRQGRMNREKHKKR